MKYVNRGDVREPVALSVLSVDQALRELQAHFRLPDDRRLTRRPPLRHEIWSGVSIAATLRTLFRNKCAYCETGVSDVSHDATTHHRPLMNAAGSTGSRKGQSPDHYAWYAYEWRNLMLACSHCSRAKGNRFPTLGDRVAPFTKWEDADDTEGALLLDPCKDDSSQHLKFVSSGECLPRTQRGKTTIDLLELNRPSLLDTRRSLFQNVLDTLALLRAGKQNNYRERLRQQLDYEAEYIGAVSNWLRVPLEESIKSKFALNVHPEQIAQQLSAFAERASDSDWERYRAQLDGARLQLDEKARQSVTDVERVRGLREGVSQRSATKVELGARITRIEIKKFKAIDSIVVDFSSSAASSVGMAPSAVLLGENATGKSSILQAIALVLMESALQKSVGVALAKLVQNGSNAKPDNVEGADEAVVIVARFDNGGTAIFRIGHGGNVMRIGTPGPLVLAYGAHRMFGSEEEAPSQFRSSASIRSLFDRGFSIPHSSKWLESVDEHTFRSVARAMREILALRSDDEIRRGSSGELIVRAHNGDRTLDELSDGYRALFAMVLDIMRNMVRAWGNLEDARGVVLIDEIEIHLHPRWKMQVVGALRRAMPQVQFIFTTHDPLCLRGMLRDEVHVFVRDEIGSIQQMSGLPDVRGMRAEQLLTSEFFGLSSTSDPEIAQEIDVRMLEAASQSGTQVHRFSAESSPFTMIGDTPAHQVVNEALRLRIIEQLQSKTLDRSKVRSDAVLQILDRLRAQERKRERPE